MIYLHKSKMNLIFLFFSVRMNFSNLSVYNWILKNNSRLKFATFENKFKAIKSQCPYMSLSSICPILPDMVNRSTPICSTFYLKNMIVYEQFSLNIILHSQKRWSFFSSFSSPVPKKCQKCIEKYRNKVKSTIFYNFSFKYSVWQQKKRLNH
jgi:hypothetical protein